MQDRAPAPPHRPVGTLRQAPADLAEQPVPLPVRHGQVTGERAEQRDVLLGGVDPFPVVLADLDHLEPTAGLDPGPVIGELPRPVPRRACGQSLADLVVDVLDLAEERIAAFREHVFLRPQGQVTAGTKRPPGLLVPDARVHPVPRRGREDQADRPIGRPVLEPSLDDLHRESGQVPARGGRELGAEFDTGDAEAPPGQREGRLARAAPHLEQVIAGLEPGEGHEVVEQGFGIVRACPIVEFRGPIERLPQPLALAVARHPASIPPR